MIIVEVTHRDGRVNVHTFAALVVEIGRAKGCEISSDDAGMGRYHTRLEVHDDTLVIVDQRAPNATCVNGLRISERTSVGWDDVIEIGRTSLRARYEPR